MSEKLSQDNILRSLKTVIDKEYGKSIVSLGMVSSIVIRDGNVGFALEFRDKDEAARKYYLKKESENAIKSFEGVKKVTIVLTAAYKKNSSEPEKKLVSQKVSVPGVKNIILVSSGKGGVGKSTIALNFALSLSRLGYKTALLDADVYGPSIPHLLNIKEIAPKIDKNNKMIPIEKYGVQTMSIGFIIDQNKAAIWRGPMATKAVYSLMLNTLWHDVEYLVVDTPPGTGDIHITLTKSFNITGTIIVSTPQKLSIVDAVKACNLFQKVSIPIIGIIENMSYFVEEKSKSKTYIFGKDGAKKMSESLKINFLGEVPINSQICEASECSNPALIDQSLIEIYDKITNNVLESLLA